ncbi:glyceraldehyde-3-phosphate dehydrogenase, testis-specific-like [Pogoniulus pusillus]|uniref:glyceraldehyde-3-phosphate dehydrogenase, testis-specific-like n=1 Tax=Pogoniulus pusillus TaxID=488313 RepID=UPI0030B96DAD
MGPARSLGLCLVLSSVAWTRGELLPCPQCPLARCLNATHCGCPPGHLPPPWPQDPPPAAELRRHQRVPGAAPPLRPLPDLHQQPGGVQLLLQPRLQGGTPPRDPRPGVPPRPPLCRRGRVCRGGVGPVRGGGGRLL